MLNWIVFGMTRPGIEPQSPGPLVNGQKTKKLEIVCHNKFISLIPRLKSDPKAESRDKPIGETPFVRKCRTVLHNLSWSSDLSRPRKELYRELVAGSASEPLSEWHGRTAEEIRSHWNWAPGSSFLNNSEFSLTWQLARNALLLFELQSGPGRHARLCSLRQWLGRNGWARLLLLRVSSPVLGSRPEVEGSHLTQAARAAWRWLRRGQRFTSVSGWEACGVARIVIRATWKKGWKLFLSWTGFVF